MPNIADSIEYSKLAASDPNAKLGSNEALNRGSLEGKDSATAVYFYYQHRPEHWRSELTHWSNCNSRRWSRRWNRRRFRAAVSSRRFTSLELLCVHVNVFQRSEAIQRQRLTRTEFLFIQQVFRLFTMPLCAIVCYTALDTSLTWPGCRSWSVRL